MSSIKDRQRAAARARLEKEMAERAAAARKRRQRQAVMGSAIVLVLVVAGTVWLVSSLGDDKGTTKKAAANPPGTINCVWTKDTSGNPSLKDVGMPPTTVPNVGTDVMTFDTNLGQIQATVDLSKVPCTAASFAYLATKKFLDNTKCHRLVDTDGFKVLQCGDPGATGKGYRQTDGQGGPSYKFAEENLPVGKDPAYPEGVIAMAKSQAPASTGSQFFIVYGDTKLQADYTVLGTITKGLDLVKAVGKAGDDKAFAKEAGGGHPKKETIIKTFTMAKA